MSFHACVTDTVYVADKVKAMLVSVDAASLRIVHLLTPGVWQASAVTVDAQNNVYFTAWDKRFTFSTVNSFTL
jgi:hypothetical protein